MQTIDKINQRIAEQRNRIIRAKEQVDSYSSLLAMVEKGDMPADVENMLIKLLLAT